MIIPKQIQIETVAGLCNVRCIMCPVDKSIRKEIMSNEDFSIILKKFLPYQEYIENVSLLGLGETFIDNNLSKKVDMCKTIGKGFKGVGVYTNGMLLNKKVSQELLDVNLDSLIISLDGISKETEETIRVGADINKIITNIEDFITLRNMNKEYKTKIIIRFTEQAINRLEWNSFYKFWENKLEFSKGDLILKYPVHNFGSKEKQIITETYNIKGLKCKEVYDRIIIFSNGEIGLCCGDQFGFYKNENIFDDDPIKIYNRGNFNIYREKMNKGNILDLDLCKNCSVAYSIISKQEYKMPN